MQNNSPEDANFFIKSLDPNRQPESSSPLSPLSPAAVSNAKRRFSLQTPPSSSILTSFATPPTSSKLSAMFVDQTNARDMRKLSGAGIFAPPPSLPPPPQINFDPNSTFTKFLLHQQQQQQSQLLQIQQKQRQAALNQENFSNFVRLCNSSGIDVSTDLNNNDNTFFGATFSNGNFALSMQRWIELLKLQT